MADRPKLRTLLDGLRPETEVIAVRAALSSERRLATKTGVSRMTARHAFDELSREGRLVRAAARGSLMARSSVNLQLQLNAFTGDVAAHGNSASSRVLRLVEELADTFSAEQLRLREGLLVVPLDHVRLADDRPMAIERTTLDATAAPGLKDIGFTETSLYGEHEHRYGVLFDAGVDRHRLLSLERDEQAVRLPLRKPRRCR